MKPCRCKIVSLRSVNCSHRPRVARCSAIAVANFIATIKRWGSRRFASRQWICCVLQFKNRQRDVWGRYYTELFFLDEVTALAAGHRPCFECRRADATAFASAFAKGQQACSRRCARRRWIASCTPSGSTAHDKRLHCSVIDDLPDGAFILRPQALVGIESGAAANPPASGGEGRARSGRRNFTNKKSARGGGRFEI